MATPATNTEFGQARVAPISGGPPMGMGIAPQPVMGVAHPMLSEALLHSRIKKFSGRAEDFEQFEKEWNFYLRLMYGASNGPLADSVVLMSLKGYLDEASAALLEGRLYDDPHLSYYEFWDELKTLHMRDARTTHRQAWKLVKLEISGRKLNAYDLAKFKNVYRAKRALVEDWTDGEDQQLVFTQIPHEFQQKILNETTKRRIAKKWVRVVVPEGLSHQNVLHELESVVGHIFENATIERRNMVIPCRDDQERRRILSMDGAKLFGKVVHFQKADYNMTGDEIFEFVQRLVDTEHKEVLRVFGRFPHPSGWCAYRKGR